MKRFTIGIDLGGTNTKLAIANELGDIIASKKSSTNAALGPDGMIRAIIESLEHLLNKEGIDLSELISIGIGVPGTVNSETGVVIFAPNIFWENVNVKQPLEQYFNLPVYVAQDTRAAAWGEYLYGLGKGAQTIACVTLGTGIGAGVIVNGKIFHGGLNTAGEFGHQIVEMNGNLCNCGRYGCLEAHAGGLAIVKRAKDVFPDSVGITVESVFNMANEGNKDAISIVNDVVYYTGLGMVNLINLISPEKVIISGGISNAPDHLLLDPLNAFINEHAYVSVANKIAIQTSVLSDAAPLIGASMLYKH